MPSFYFQLYFCHETVEWKWKGWEKEYVNIRRLCKLHDKMQFVICHKFFNLGMQAFRVVITCGMHFNNNDIVCYWIVHLDGASRCIRYLTGDAINPQNNETYSLVSLQNFRCCSSTLQLDFGFTCIGSSRNPLDSLLVVLLLRLLLLVLLLLQRHVVFVACEFLL